jgi:hypothetical protein
MDLTGIANGGVLVPITVLVAVFFVVLLLARAIRRSTARMAEQHSQWLSELPSSTRAHYPTNTTTHEIHHLTR